MDNRALLMHQALKLFAARGYDATGVQEIVDESGLTKPTLYHYFGSKRGLLEALLAEQFAALAAQLAGAAAYHGDLPLTLRKITAVYFAFAQHNPSFYRLALALWLAPAGSEGFHAVAPHLQQQQDLLEEVFQQAAHNHGNMRGRQRAYAATFYGMINTYISLALNGRTALDEHLSEQAVHQFEHGIYS